MEDIPKFITRGINSIHIKQSLNLVRPKYVHCRIYGCFWHLPFEVHKNSSPIWYLLFPNCKIITIKLGNFKLSCAFTVDPSTTACSALQQPPAMPSDNCYLCPGPHPSPLLTCQNLCSSTERKTHRLWSLSKAIQIYAFLVGVFPLMRSSDEEVASSDQTKKNWKKLAGTHVPTIRVPRRLATWWLQNRCPSAGLRST